MIETLLQSELAQLAVGIGSGIAAFIAVYKGKKASVKKNVETYDVNHEILKKIQLIHEDLIRVITDMPQIQLVKRDVESIDKRLIELAKSIAVMMNTENITFEKVDNIESIVQILRALDKRG